MASKKSGDSVPADNRKTPPEVVEPMIPHAHRDEIEPQSPAPPHDNGVVEPMIPHNRRTDME
jgi:hypothetical protein